MNDLLVSVRTDTRQILTSADSSKYPFDKIELFLGDDGQSTQMSALVHELLYARHANDTTFTFAGVETGEFNGAPVTVRRYNASDQYLCGT